MTGELALKEWIVPEIMFHLNTCPSYQLSAVAIMLRFQLCSAHCSTTNEKQQKRPSSRHEKYRQFTCPSHQLLPQKSSGHYTLLSAMFSPLQSVTNKEQY